MEKSGQMELRLAPIVKMGGVAAIVALAIYGIYAAARLLPNYKHIAGEASWILADLVHVPQFVIPFILICYITRGRLSEYGFNLNQKPPIFTHKRMLALGASFGLLMSLQYVVQAARRLPVEVPQPVTPINILGYMTFQWIVVGLAEETLFRGLIQTYLVQNLRGTIRVVGHDLHIGTIIAALIWGAFHFINILVMPIGPVISSVLFTTIAGLLMGYAYQQTGSLLTTILVHNTIFGVPLTIGYLLYGLT